MTVTELIDKLREMPGDLPVMRVGTMCDLDGSNKETIHYSFSEVFEAHPNGEGLPDRARRCFPWHKVPGISCVVLN